MDRGQFCEFNNNMSAASSDLDLDGSDPGNCELMMNVEEGEFNDVLLKR
jgi:hypothetical protein